MGFQTFLSLVGPLSIIIALIVMALLSQRLGAVTKRAPIYRWFFLSVALIAVSIMVQLLSPDGLDYKTALLFDIPFAIGLTLAVVIAWRYWSWLLGERGNNG